MPGKRQKPVAALQDQRASRVAGLVRALPGGTPALTPPRAPEGLTAAVRRHWGAFWRSPSAHLVNLNSDLPALHRYFRLLSEREKLEKEIGQNLLVKGRDGVDVLNPLFRLTRQYTREIWKYEEQFGVMPLNRVRLGIAHNEQRSGVAELRAQLDAMRAPARRVYDAKGGKEVEVIDLDML